MLLAKSILNAHHLFFFLVYIRRLGLVAEVIDLIALKFEEARGSQASIRLIRGIKQIHSDGWLLALRIN